ncbi:protein jag [Campylobacter sp. MIT 12-8780]|uniref:Jag N-terminal domain-containing protein n=1 Tax=unclassified Campylobacter TaxID=2593542 RepID=UPI00115CFC43|nr:MULTISPECIES: Jag N-terminal domain-containing protein [unclassified Campylobacter]NDJ26405.1 protein jag [Campylobacter sp. MIT 19-121]TQR42981.1 protein jag [Campylobacter sp. MIT 12-8780]
MRVEAKDLQSALTQAAQNLSCSVMDLEYEVIQQASKGFLGFFQKNAIIEAKNKKKPYHKADKQNKKREFDKTHRSFEDKNFSYEKKPYIKAHDERLDERVSEKNTEKTLEKQAQEYKSKERLKAPSYTIKEESIFASFHKEEQELKDPEFYLEEIKTQLKNLMAISGFKIAISELRVYSKDSIYIKLDGEDAALLIGKEGYRYKALSYLLHNWINSKYKLLVRLEIAEFLKNQEQGMDFYLKNIIEKVEATGRAQTKHLDGVLVKIALEKLRERFPNKYVGIRQNGDQKFVVVNDFFKKDE